MISFQGRNSLEDTADTAGQTSEPEIKASIDGNCESLELSNTGVEPNSPSYLNSSSSFEIPDEGLDEANVDGADAPEAGRDAEMLLIPSSTTCIYNLHLSCYAEQLMGRKSQETQMADNSPPQQNETIQLGRHDRLMQRINNLWVLEFFSWVLSAACLIWIFLALYFRQDKPLPRWPFAITINVLLSVLSAIMKSSLLLPVEEAIGQLKWSWFRTRTRPLIDFEVFDSATRGPWGSVFLLFTNKGRCV